MLETQLQLHSRIMATMLPMVRLLVRRRMDPQPVMANYAHGALLPLHLHYPPRLVIPIICLGVQMDP